MNDRNTVPYGERLSQLNIACALMGNATWKNEIGAPPHDHTNGSETGLTYGKDGSQLTRLWNCPRCGERAADGFWELALEEALYRIANGVPSPSGMVHFKAAS